MNGRGFITISMHELERVKIIESVVQHGLTIVLAAERLELCERQVSRLVRRYEAAGPAGLVSARRGQPSNRELPIDLRARAMALVRERYADFGQTLACEKLAECHGVVLGKETVRRWMREAGLWIPRKQRELTLEDLNAAVMATARTRHRSDNVPDTPDARRPLSNPKLPATFHISRKSQPEHRPPGA